MGHVDQYINIRTGFRPTARAWVYHDMDSLRRFYNTPYARPEPDPSTALNPLTDLQLSSLQPGHLVARLFLSGPSLVTLWSGQEVCQRLCALKGPTHPAQASSEQIRGRFWCDNPACNLIHTSDDYNDVQRELDAIGLLELLSQSSALPLLEPAPLPQTRIRHSAVVMLCELVDRVQLTALGTERAGGPLPKNGEAQRCLSLCCKRLVRAVRNSSLELLINNYLEGNVVAVNEALSSLPLTSWERFVVLCGTVSRDAWTEAAGGSVN